MNVQKSLTLAIRLNENLIVGNIQGQRVLSIRTGQRSTTLQFTLYVVPANELIDADADATRCGPPRMQNEIAANVHAVIGQGAGPQAEAGAGRRADPGDRTGDARTVALGRVESRRLTDLATRAEVRYALACWLDEVFVLDPVWGSRWNEHKLEVSIFGTNDRAWMFWEKARLASGRTETDILEVYYLCVMLGFRGELREDPEKLQAWSVVARGQIEKGPGQGWAAPPELDPPASVPPLKGQEALQTMMVRCTGWRRWPDPGCGVPGGVEGGALGDVPVNRSIVRSWVVGGRIAKSRRMKSRKPGSETRRPGAWSCRARTRRFLSISSFFLFLSSSSFLPCFLPLPSTLQSSWGGRVEG